MKKLLTILLTLSVATSTQAQEIYLKAGVGYAFPHAGQSVDQNGFPYSGSAQYVSGSTFATFKSKRVSFASGVPASIGVGYFFTKNIGVEVNVIVGVSNTEHTGSFNAPSATSNNINISEVYNEKASMPILASPSLVLRSKGLKAYVYTRVGLLVPISVRMKQSFTQTQTHTASPAKTKYTGTSETKTAFSLGYTGALGASLKVVNHVRIFGELSLQSMSVYAKESELKSLEQNGVNVIGQVAPSARTVTYKKNSNGADQEVSYAYPFSNFGFNVGLSVDLK